MALQVYTVTPRTSMAQISVIIGAKQQSTACFSVAAADYTRHLNMKTAEKQLRRGFRVKCSSDGVAAAAVAEVGQVTEVNKDTFWPIVKAAGGKTVVLDMYTQWCGPCKVIAPKFQELSEKYEDVVFLKLDCNQDNKIFEVTDLEVGELQLRDQNQLSLNSEKMVDQSDKKENIDQYKMCEPLAKELGIQVVPTFKILKDGKIVKEVTGAKFDDLVAAIETARSST